MSVTPDTHVGASRTASGSKDAWRRDAVEVAAALGADVRRGLSAEEGAARLARFGPNRLEEAQRMPAWRKFVGQFADPLIYLLLAAVVVSLVAWVLEGGEAAPYDAIVIAAIVVANAVLGYVQEARAEHAVAALQRMSAATAGVVRDGREERIPAAEVVPGDILTLAEGDAVAADGRLVEAASLTVAEASLTGESEAVLKETGPIAEPVGLGDRVNMVFSGTAVVRGRGRAVVTATAMATEMGNVARLLGRTEAQTTPLQREVDRLGRMLGIAVIVIAAVVVGAILLTADLRSASDLVSVLLVGVSLAVAAVPEGLPAVLSVVLALGVQRMAQQRAIVKKLSSVETLGSASVICSDKTGTLTKNEMTIEKVVTGSGEVDVTGSGYRPEGELRVDGRPLDDPVLLDEVRAVLVGGSLANDAVLREVDGEWAIQGDPTEAAFLVAEAKVQGLTEERRARFERVGEVPFSSERKLMSTLHADLDREPGIAVVTKGAPDVLLARCTEERLGGRVRPLSEARRTEILTTVERLADHALRTLAVAYRPLPVDERPPHDESVERELVYLGIVGIIDPPRPEARAAIADADAAGMRVLMITGDHPHTAARIAADLGIAAAGSRVITGDELEAMDDDACAAAVREVSVYARVSPEHKLRIVDALHADGRIVAMTGDGVNDAPALKAADIGVAMGVAGTEVAKEAADMILADDNFATIVSAVREGRGIFANIRKFLRFLLSSNIGEVLHDVLRGRAGRRDRAGGHRRGDRGAAARDADPLDQPAHRRRAGARARHGRAARRRDVAAAARAHGPRDRRRDVDRHRLGRRGDGGRDAARARPPAAGRVRRRLRQRRRGADDGVHDPGVRAALQLLQRALRPHERLPPAVHEPMAVGRDRALRAAPGGGRAAAVPQRRVRHGAARARRVADLRRARERRSLGRRGQEAARPPAPLPNGCRARGAGERVLTPMRVG